MNPRPIPKLHRCFCGGKVRAIISADGFRIECRECGATDIVHENIETVCEDWNKRQGVKR